MEYGFYATVPGPFDAAVQQVTDGLKKEGFGVLSDIDIRNAMKAEDASARLHRVCDALKAR